MNEHKVVRIDIGSSVHLAIWSTAMAVVFAFLVLKITQGIS